ncbi:MAG: translation initiation factor IF-3 [Chloroflexota bacterium]|nr:translation initiation factor IF-3 [Chloroflexota bacterium]
MNQRIAAREVRLVGEDGQQLGVMPTARALEIAREQGYDLVEVAPQAEPPVCRLIDYGKFKYEQTKKEREARKKQKTVVLREVRFRPKIGQHDIEFKTRTIKKLLEEGDKVKVSVLFRGREITHPELGRELLERVIAEVGEVAVLEKMPTMEQRNMHVILVPAKERKAVKGTPDAQAEDT